MKSKKDQLTTSRWPMWELRANEFLDGIRHWVAKGGEDSFVAFHADFLSLLDVFLSELITWSEQENEEQLRQWAGRALAERLQFLKSQERDWLVGNSAFAATRSGFGDRRHARSPRSYLGWLACDYLRAMMRERRYAPIFLRRPPFSGMRPNTFAKTLGYPKKAEQWLKRLKKLPAFSPESASQWAEMVYERMSQDEEAILNAPEMRKSTSRESRDRRKSGAVRLSDYHSTVIRAVKKQASKSIGSVRGVTRPG